MSVWGVMGVAVGVCLGLELCFCPQTGVFVIRAPLRHMG